MRLRKIAFFIILILAPGLLTAASILGTIKIDHFGYRTTDTKTAYFTANPGASVEVHDANTNALILATTLVTDKGTDISSPLMSGDHVWWVDFSALTSPGTYYLYSPALAEQSYNFQVSDTRYQAPVTAALKALYYARCGVPKTAANGGVWNDAACHTADLNCAAFCSASASYPSSINFNYGTLNLEGGWHDAGDYEKKIGPGISCGVTETGDNGDTLWYLLTAYELNPGLFPPNQINLPESGDGLPDILNQAKWELDWYLKMQMADGHVLEGVHVTNLGTLASPPSADTTPRGYMPPSYESEAVFVASTAHAARLFAGVPAGASYAATLKAAALATWNDWVLNSPTTVSALSYLPYANLKVWAASEIFRMDPTQSAAQSVVDNFTTWSSFTMNPAGPYPDWALFNYLQTPGATAATTTAMATALGNFVNTTFGQDDLYHSGMAAWMYPWGSNQIKACDGLELFLAGKLGITGSTYTASQCVAHAEDFLHYFHGANPMNMVYITNTDSMGAKHCVWRVFNSWFGQYTTSSSLVNYIGIPTGVTDPLYPYVAADAVTSNYGPPPGYVPDGPTYQYFQLGGTDVPPDSAGPAEAPYTKAYRDYNNGNQPWVVNEAGIYNESSYMALSSVFAGSTFATFTPTSTPSGTITPVATPTPTASPTVTTTPTATSTYIPSAYCPVTVLDDFENQALNGVPPARTNLWGGHWTTLVSGATMGVSYNNPGANGSLYSAGVTGSITSGTGYAEWYTPIYASSAPFNAASYGIQGIQLWMKGDGNAYRVEVASQAVTDYDYYGVDINTPSDGKWYFYPIPFSTMTRQTWGTQTGLPGHPTATDLTEIIFVTQATPASYAFSVDQIAFYCSGAFTPTPAFTPTSTPSATPTPTVTLTFTPTPTMSPTTTFTLTSSQTPTITQTPISTSTPTKSPTPTYTETWTLSPTPTPTFSITTTPSLTATISPTPTTSFTSSPTPTLTLTIQVGSPFSPVLYPNPVTGTAPALLHLYLTAPIAVRVQMFTTSFRKIWNKTFNQVVPGQDLTLPSAGPDGNPLSNGLYYVVVTVNGKREILKLVVLK
jgi:hypothetical protein